VVVRCCVLGKDT